jgi:hypothetical protein
MMKLSTKNVSSMSSVFDLSKRYQLLKVGGYHLPMPDHAYAMHPPAKNKNAYQEKVDREHKLREEESSRKQSLAIIIKCKSQVVEKS